MEQEEIYLSTKEHPGCSHYIELSRSSLELYKLQSNGQNFPPIGQVANTFTPSFRSMYWAEHTNLGDGSGVKWNAIMTTDGAYLEIFRTSQIFRR